MSDAPINPTGQSVGDIEAPPEFGADFAEVFGRFQTRDFNPNAQRGAADGGEVPGGAVAEMGNEPGSLGVDVPPGGWPDAPAGERPDVATDIFAVPPTTEPVAAPVVEQTPAVDGQPGGAESGSEVAPAPSLPDPSAQPTSELPPPAPEPTASDGWVFTYEASPGVQAQHKFTNDEVELALSVKAWADNIPEATRHAMGAIEDGQAVAVPRADYDQFQAWQAQQQRTQRDADLDNYDEDAAREIQRLRDEIAQARIGGPERPTQVPANIDANLTGAAVQYDQAARQYQQQFGLSEDELTTLVQSVVDSNIMSGLQQRHTQVNPATGKIIKVDGHTAMRQALDAAMTWNPNIGAAIAARSAATQQAPSPVQQQAPQVDPVTTKKAAAASLASAPSAAVPPAPRNTALSGQALVDAMAAELLDHMNK